MGKENQTKNAFDAHKRFFHAVDISGNQRFFEDAKEEEEEKDYHIVLNSRPYKHPWYGTVLYDLDKMNRIRENHIDHAFKEDINLYKGHRGWSNSDDASFGTYSRDKEDCKIVKYKYKDKNGKKKEAYALVLAVNYTEEGKRLIEEKVYKYLSSEIYNNYVEREFDDEQEVLEEEVKELEAWKKGEVYVPKNSKGVVLSGVAMTNNPFFHLPKIEEMNEELKQEVEIFSCDDLGLDADEAASSPFHRIGGEVYFAMSGGSLAHMKTLSSPDLNEESRVLFQRMSDNGIWIPKCSYFSFDSVIPREESSEPTPSDLSRIEPPRQKEVVSTYENQEVQTPEERGRKMKELLTKFKNMTLEELQNFDMSSAEIENSEKEVVQHIYENCLEAAKYRSDLEKEKLEREKIKAQFSSKIMTLEQEIAQREELLAEKSQLAFSTRVEKLASDLEGKNFPKSVVDTVKEIFSDVDVAERDKKFSFSNVADEKEYSLDLFDIVEKITDSIDPKIFDRNTAVITTEVSTPDVVNTEEAGEEGESSFSLSSMAKKRYRASSQK